MNMVRISFSKKAGEGLSAEEIRFFRAGAAATIPGLPAFGAADGDLLAGHERKQETTCLTMEMMHSGGVVESVRHRDGSRRDASPLAAGRHDDAGARKAAGSEPAARRRREDFRLRPGHGRGTLDKLESIPGCSVRRRRRALCGRCRKSAARSSARRTTSARRIRRFTALRDVTGTVDRIPLIASSIVSKKLKSGAGAIVLDEDRQRRVDAHAGGFHRAGGHG